MWRQALGLTPQSGMDVRAKMRGWLMQQNPDCWAWQPNHQLQCTALNKIWNQGTISLSAMLGAGFRYDTIALPAWYMNLSRASDHMNDGVIG